MIISVPYNADIVAHEKCRLCLYLHLEVVLKLAIVYMLLVFSFDKLVLYAFLLLAIQILIRFCYSYYCNKHFEETKYKHVWDKALFKEMTGLPVGVCLVTWQLYFRTRLEHAAECLLRTCC